MVDLHDKPGAMGRSLATSPRPARNIDVAYTIFTGVRLVILTEDTEKRASGSRSERRRGLGRNRGRGVAR